MERAILTFMGVRVPRGAWIERKKREKETNKHQNVVVGEKAPREIRSWRHKKGRKAKAFLFFCCESIENGRKLTDLKQQVLMCHGKGIQKNRWKLR